jgi:type II secretory pathway pseudopilin PulG
MKTRKKKKTLTLIEIMIVIVLIGLIGSVIGVNMKDSLDEGRAFKTRQAQEQIRDILMLEVARGASLEEVISNKAGYLENSGMVKNVRKLLNDGWDTPFDIKIKNDDISVTSEKLKAYERKKKNKLSKTASVVQETETNEK